MLSLEVRFSFLCRSSYTNNQGKSPLLLRVHFNGDRRDIFTGLYCFKKYWDPQSARILKADKSSISINQNLDLILRKANHCFDSMRFSGNVFSIDELTDKIRGKEEKPEMLMEFLAEEIKKTKKRVGIDLTQSSYYRYSRTLRYMQDFLQSEYRTRNYTLSRIDLKFLETYFQYLRRDKKISHNTAHKYLMLTKMNLSPAIKSGIIKGDPFRELKIKSKPVHRDFLTPEELNKIIKVKLNDPDLNRKRDIFLFACYTGLSYIDLTQLAGNNLMQDHDGSWYIRSNRQKTGEQSIIPLLPAAEKILRKHCSSDDLRGFNWFISSNQKMNKGLKSIGKRSEISKALHMHLARHTFATTVTLSNGVPIESVSKMLGHSNIRITQHYAKVVSMKVKWDMGKIRDLYK